MTVAARLKDNGDMLVAGEINERMPVVTDGLVSYLPLDGRGGAFDIVGGHTPKENLVKGVNLLEALSIDWRDPSSWRSNRKASYSPEYDAVRFEDYHNTWLNTPIVIDPAKTYQISAEVMVESRPDNESLYLGGYSLNKDGVRATRNYDYTMASYERPPLGEWTTFRLTRTGTATAYSGDSFSFNTVKGWTGDKTAEQLADRLIRYYHFGGLFNYASYVGGVTYIRNLSIEIVDDDPTDVIRDEEEVAAEPAVTNTWTGGFSIYNNYGVPSSIVELDETYKGQPIYRVGMTVTDAHADHLNHFRTSLASHGVYGGSQEWKDATKYTSSIYWRPVNKPDMVFGGTASNTGGWLRGENIPAEDGWTRYYRYRDGTINPNRRTDAIHHSFYCPSLQLNETIYFDVTCPQTEEGVTRPSSYTPSSRKASSFELDSELGLTTYTVTGTFIPNLPFKTSSVRYDEGQINSSILFGIEDKVGVGRIWYRYWEGTNAVSAPYLSRTGTYQSGNMHKYYELKENEPVFFVIKKTGTTFTFQAYQDGWKDVHTATVDSGARLDAISFGHGTTSFGAIYRDVSIYNRILDDKEIDKLRGSSLSADVNGIISSVTESPIHNATAIHFPLTGHGNSSTNAITPSVERGVVYDDKGVWIGASKRNVVTNTNLDTGWSKNYETNIRWNDIAPPPGVPYDQQVVSFEDNSTTGYWFSYGNYAPQDPGKTYTISVYVRVEGDPVSIRAFTAANGVTGRQWTEYVQVKPEDGWKRVVFNPVVNPVDSQSKSLSFQWPIRNGRMWLCAPQMEEGTYATPFVDGTRETSLLEWDLSPLDVRSTNWTIFGWFNPYEYKDNMYFLRKNGTPNLSIGSYRDNTFAPLWSNGSNGAARTAGGDFPKDTEKWRFFAFSRDGSIARSYEGFEGTLSMSTADDRGIYFDVHETLGWKLFGSSNFNGYVKDLHFAYQALSYEELEAIYKTPLRLKKHGFQIPGQIKEGVILDG